MQNYQIYMFAIPALVIIFIIIYTIIWKKQISTKQKEGFYDNAFNDLIAGYLIPEEKIESFIEANWRSFFNYHRYLLVLTDKRLILIKDPGNTNKAILLVAKKFSELSNINVQEISIMERGNMQTIYYPAKKISFDADGESYTIKSKYDGSFREDHNDHLAKISSFMENLN